MAARLSVERARRAGEPSPPSGGEATLPPATSPSGGRPPDLGPLPPRLLTVAAILLAVGLGLALIGYRGPNGAKLAFLPDAGAAQDFRAYYLAAGRLMAGQPLYTEAWPDSFATSMEFIHRPEGSVYVYPPFFAAALRPLATLEYGLALVVWGSGLRLALVGSWVWLYLAAARQAGIGRRRALAIGGALLPVLLFAYPVHESLQLGQPDGLFSLLLVGAFVAARRRLRLLAGVALAPVAAIKPLFLPLLAPFGLRRDGRALAGALVTLAALTGWGIWSSGPTETFAYPELLIRSATAQQASFPVNQSPYGFARRLLTDNGYIDPLAVWPAGPVLLLLAIWLGAVLLYLRALGGRPAKPDVTRDLELTLFTLLTLFVCSPMLEPAYLTSVLTFAVTLAGITLGRARRSRDVAFGLALVGLSLCLGYPSLLDWTYRDYRLAIDGGLVPASRQVLASSYLYGVLALYGLLAVRLRRADRREQRSS